MNIINGVVNYQLDYVLSEPFILFYLWCEMTIFEKEWESQSKDNKDFLSYHDKRKRGVNIQRYVYKRFTQVSKYFNIIFSDICYVFFWAILHEFVMDVRLIEYLIWMLITRDETR